MDPQINQKPIESTNDQNKMISNDSSSLGPNPILEKIAWKLVAIPIFLMLAFFILTIVTLGNIDIVVLSLLSQYKALDILVKFVLELPLVGAILLLVLVGTGRYTKKSTRLGAILTGMSVIPLWLLVTYQELVF